MKKEVTKKTASKQTSIDWQKLQDNKQSIIDFIVQGAEAKTKEQFTDPHLDRRNEIIKLQGGAEVSLKQIQDTIARSLQEYAPRFYKEWYKEIFRLNGWEREDAEMYLKPHIVAHWTNELIYARFNKEVLPVIQGLNPYIATGVRMHKHHQWLSADGLENLSRFIDESYAVMKTCATWHEFRVKYGKLYGVPYQMSAFEKN